MIQNKVKAAQEWLPDHSYEEDTSEFGWWDAALMQRAENGTSCAPNTPSLMRSAYVSLKPPVTWARHDTCADVVCVLARQRLPFPLIIVRKKKKGCISCHLVSSILSYVQDNIAAATPFWPPRECCQRIQLSDSYVFLWVINSLLSSTEPQLLVQNQIMFNESPVTLLERLHLYFSVTDVA